MNFIKAIVRAVVAPKMSEEDRFLAKAVDHKDLENRMRSLDRMGNQRFGRGF